MSWLGKAIDKTKGVGFLVKLAANWQVYALAATTALAAASGAYIWHGWEVDGVHDAAFAAGQSEVQARWDKATQEAVSVQVAQNATATTEVIVTETVTQTQYRDRIKEVIRYVPKPDTVCPADPEFVRLFNGTN